jgi:hypothetical protein
MEKKLGKLERVKDLRGIWPNEARDFTVWLSKEENLALLSNTIGINIVPEERESSVGDFSVDLFATEEGTNRKIIIENQLEDTNHDHLGKIITYASGKDAEVIIWIVKRARDEHKQAIEWLNQHTDDNIGFFLLEIELWKIEGSLPAVKLNVVERPNDWAKSIKVAEGLSDTKKLQIEFWQEFNNYAESDDNFNRGFSIRKPQPQHWYDLSIGSSSYHLGLTINSQKKRIGAEFYFSDDKALYNKFKARKSEIEEYLGTKVETIEAAKDCRIIALHPNIDIKKREDWKSAYQWLCTMSIKLKQLANKIEV